MKKKVLFVCTGNICRSPTAEAVFAAKVAARGLQDRFAWDSAGTHGYHIGDNPDSRTVAAARKRGVEMASLVARRVTSADYDDFDLILAMDSGHLRILEKGKPAGSKAEVALYLPYVGVAHTLDVPDPYYEGPQLFEQVLDLTHEATDLLIEKLLKQ